MKEAESVIKTIQLTEKGSRLSETEGKYFFKVDVNANKEEIKRSVEELFGVNVTKVNTFHRVGKPKRDRRQKTGYKPQWKRAVVTLKEGESIDFT